ncbi:MAG: class I tRNA ligase family protein [Dehalococcoidia bacterium]|nr:class I tRNA ligase family protein [Dehalococcoidia bacterium]
MPSPYARHGPSIDAREADRSTDLDAERLPRPRRGATRTASGTARGARHPDRSRIPSEQWWVDVACRVRAGASLAERRSRACASRRHPRSYPQRFEKVYLNWMDNIRDWCISRQLWWGHQIPVWYCDDCGEMTVQVEDPERCTCGGTLQQDPDVLDTWFSSGLAPHADLGWPDDTEDLRTYYPTTDMQMGYDIMFFWCARMIMMSLYNMRHRPFEEAIPYRTVMFHGLIRDANGDKMTKSRGNVVDPLIAAGEYGADAFRFALVVGASIGADQRFGDERLAASRNFANKLWNSARFVLSRLDDGVVERPDLARQGSMPLEDRWILSRLEQLRQDVDSLLSAYQLGEAGRYIQDFLWGEFCDWYIEIAKVRLNAGDESVKNVLAHVLDHGLRLLHPMMPFVTEAIWQNLRGDLPGEEADMLIVASYPRSESAWKDAGAEAAMSHVIEVNRAIRNLRAEHRVPAGERSTVYLRASDYDAALRETVDATSFTSRVEVSMLGSRRCPARGQPCLRAHRRYRSRGAPARR